MKKILKTVCCLILIYLAYQVGTYNILKENADVPGALHAAAETGLTALESLTSGSKSNTEAPTEIGSKSTEWAETETDTPISMNTDAEENSGIRPEFRKAMDEYEAFFDEYCSLMQKLADSPDNVTLLMQYASFMSQYNDYMKSMNDLESDDLSTEELAYYIEATARIEVKLLEAASYE